MRKQHSTFNPRLRVLMSIVKRESLRHLNRARFAVAHRRAIKRYFESNKVRKLQIGSGQNSLNGWLSTDINPTREILFLDARKKFPFGSETFDYIYSEHLIEHLEYRDGERFVQECFRVLKLGGKIRVSTPNLRSFFELYVADKTDIQNRYVAWVIDTFTNFRVHEDTFVINNLFRSWGHKFIYDYKTIKAVLEKCGFVDVVQCGSGESSDPVLQKVELHGSAENVEFNRLDSLVVEGMKPESVQRGSFRV